MNSEVIKNFRLEIQTYTPEEIGQSKYKEYLFICRNCQAQSRRLEAKLDPLKLEFVLSLHLMQCINYQEKIE
jgi:hypothetical protein